MDTNSGESTGNSPEEESASRGQEPGSAPFYRTPSRPTNSQAFTSSSWRKLFSDQPSEPASATANELPDNYVPVPPRNTSKLNPTGRQAHSAIGPRQQRGQLSGAGASRASRSHAFNGRQKPTTSYMKQTCLPVDERDPDLLLAEQNKGRRLPNEAYKPGMLFRAPHHEPFLPGMTNFDDRTKTDSLFGPVFTKIRKMVVVAVFHDNYLALPIYTHNGNGLQGKLRPDEFVSLRDHRSQEPFAQLSKHPALVTQTMNPGVDLLHPKATAHLTYPVSRKFIFPVTPEGQLEKSSTEALITLFNDTVLRPRKV